MGMGEDASGLSFLIPEQDSRHIDAFHAIFAAEGIEASKIVPRANCDAQRFL
jgi:hypothetical protein